MNTRFSQPNGFVAETLERVHAALRTSGHVPFPDRVIAFLETALSHEATRVETMMQLLALCSVRPDDGEIVDMIVTSERLLYRAGKKRVVVWGRMIFREKECEAGPSIVQGHVAYAKQRGNRTAVTIAGETVEYEGPFGKWWTNRRANNDVVVYEAGGATYANHAMLFAGNFRRVYLHSDGARLTVRPDGPEDAVTVNLSDLRVLPEEPSRTTES